MEKLTKSQVIAALKKNRTMTVVMCPCKCDPKSMWGISLTNDFSDVDTFTKTVDSFTYYNCNNELGKYPAYYGVTQ